MKLGFFTSYNCGIGLWTKVGTLYREMALYRCLANSGVEVHVFAIDRERDIVGELNGKAFEGLTVHCLYPNWLPYSRLVALLLMPIFLLRNRKLGRAMDVLKTNQGHAGIHVYWASKIWKKPYVSRSGYVLNEQLKNRKDHPIKDIVQAWCERITMRNAAVCFVPSEYHVEWCEKNMDCQRVVCMPNNVDTVSFKPSDGNRSNYVVSVGRVVRMKRQDMILRACKQVDVPLMLVGAGPFLEELERVADEIGAKLNAIGRVENSRLPKIYGQSVVYVIASEYEGHPKTLVEAMACGCVCIGTKNPGIENQIIDGVNGLLVDDNENAIAAAIQRVISDGAFARELRDGARQYAVEHFDLRSLANAELRIFDSIAMSEGVDHVG